jgi:Polyketide cyclase / dehydrase and lipid transport
MAAIHEELSVEVEPAKAWAALRQVGRAHELFAPVLVDARLDGDTRTVRFANGMVARERILDVDEQRRRVAYTVLDVPGLTFHHASMQVVEDGSGRCVFVWITDFLPEEAGASIRPLIEQGAQALKKNLETR